MGLPVAAHQTGPVHRKDHVQVLHTDIHHHLVKGPLQKGGVDSHHRHQPSQGQPSGEGDGVLLRNAHVKKPFREHISKALQPGTRGHGRSHRHHLGLPVPEFSHNCGENICVGGFPSLAGGNPRVDLEGGGSVEPGRMPHGGPVTLALLGEHMYQNRPFHALGILKNLYHLAHIVAVHGPQIGDPHVLKEHARNHQLLQAVLGLAQSIYHLFPHIGNLAQGPGDSHLQIRVGLGGPQVIQVAGKPAHVGGYGHVVVI